MNKLCGTEGLWTGRYKLVLLSELNNSGVAISSATGYTSSATLGGPNDVAVDSSGNVWVADDFVLVTLTNGTNIVEFVAAVPVLTPISVR